MKLRKQWFTAVLCGLALGAATAGFGAEKKSEAVDLTPAGQEAFEDYSRVLTRLRARLKPQIPSINTEEKTAFLELYRQEKGGQRYKRRSAALREMKAARPLLKDLYGFLSSDRRDDPLVTCAVLVNAEPRRLAAYVQQGPREKKRVNQLLRNPKLMKQMLVAGGAKDGRYWATMEILEKLQASPAYSPDGVLYRLALATSLELAAPDMMGLEHVDPVHRYEFFVKSYHDGVLTPHFKTFTIWQLRQVVNDLNTDADMAWMQEMLANYRPDFITAPEGFRAHYVGLMASEFGHKKPEWDKDAPTTKIQQTIDTGGQCGPKAFFGRCLGRSFGLPVWGARNRSHTAMTYWTPKGWTTILGINWDNSFWVVDKADPKISSLFRLDLMAREYPGEYIKACRAQWIGDVLGEEKVKAARQAPHTGGLANALALNYKRIVVMKKRGEEGSKKRPWVARVYKKDEPKTPEHLMQVKLTAEDRKMVKNADGSITIPAVACVTPTANTDKILFLDSIGGGKQLHYKRWEQPEPFSYEVDVAEAGDYDLAGRVVTVNQDQFFLLRVNGADEPVRMELPYTVGKWEESEPVTVPLKKGRNTLTFTRTVPEDFEKNGWQYAGPQFGGISVKSFMLSGR